MAQTKEKRDEFIQWFNSLSKRRDVVRLFCRGDFYTVYGKSESEDIADQHFRTRKAIKSYEGESRQIECIHFSPNLLPKVLKNYVIRRKMTVEIYHKDEDSGRWQVRETKNMSNLSEGSMGEAAFNLCAVVLSVSKQTKTVGIALYNHSSSAFEIAEYIEDAQFSKLSSVLVAKGVQRCILHSPSAKQHGADLKKLEKLMVRHEVQLVDVEEDRKFWSVLKNEAATIRSIQNLINRQSAKRLQGLSGHSKALGALHGIIEHEELLKDDQNFYRFSLREYRIDSFMRLDGPALSALNLFPSGSDCLAASAKSTKHSLFGILGQCSSPMGNRLLATWIRQPLVDIAALHRRQKLVKLFVANTETREILRDEHFKSLTDFEKLVQRLLRNKGSLKDLVDIYNFVEKLPFIKESLEAMDDVEFAEGPRDGEERASPLEVVRSDIVSPIDRMMAHFNNFLAMIEQVVDLGKVADREYVIRPAFDVVLDGHTKRERKLLSAMERERSDAAEHLGVDNIGLVDHKKWGYCLRAPKSLNNKLRPKKKGKRGRFEILQMMSSNTLFLPIDGAMRALSKSHRECSERKRKRQQVIVAKTLEIAKTYLPVIHEVISVFSELDAVLALSSVASDSPTAYVLPTVLPQSAAPRVLRLKNARHPMLELIQMDDANEVIPNDLEMVGGRSSFQLVTGPNMGGKSTYIRMAGLIVLMAQIGSYVPCDEATVTVVDSVLCRVGAGDHQMKGVSTFMAEMLETASILEGATKHSLVIVDELGRGTSTYDGYGIALAISEHILERIGAFCLFATHFHELAALEQSHRDAVNKHVATLYDDDSLVMLYKIEDGPCEQSYGVEVAKLAKFPNDVIEAAQRHLDRLESARGHSLAPTTPATAATAAQLSEDTLAAMRRVVECARSHKEAADYHETLQRLVEEEVKNSDELNELCKKMEAATNCNQSKAAENMETDDATA